MKLAACLVLLVAFSAACATTKVTPDYAAIARSPKPERILVHAFATSPEDVKLDHSVSTLAWKLEGGTESAERRKVGHAVADKLADHLVTKLQALGFSAQRGTGPAPRDGIPTLVIEGQFLAIQEGSRTARVVIGLGAGRSEVRTAVHAIEILPAGSRLLETFEIDAKSDSTPGMAETMGAGAAAGHLATSAAVSAAKSVASEEFGADVEADALRTASKISDVLADFFAGQGWIARPES